MKKFKTIEEAEKKLKHGEPYILDTSNDIPEVPKAEVKSSKPVAASK